MPPPMSVPRALRFLEENGLLLLSDAEWPSLVALVAGGPVKGSWWGHPLGNAIYNLGSALEDHKAVLRVKLVGGKVTYVHRQHWSDLLAMVAPPKPWQKAGLESPSAALLKAVAKVGSVRLDKLPSALAKSEGDLPVAAKDLEKRLLVLTQSVHTERGAHATVLTSWSQWAEEKSVKPTKDVDSARANLAALTRTWPTGKRKVFPWPAPR